MSTKDVPQRQKAIEICRGANSIFEKIAKAQDTSPLPFFEGFWRVYESESDIKEACVDFYGNWRIELTTTEVLLKHKTGVVVGFIFCTGAVEATSAYQFLIEKLVNNLYRILKKPDP